MKYLLVVLLALLSLSANAQVTVFVGETKFHQAHDGIWIQEGLPHTKKITSPSLEINYMFKKDRNWEYSVGAIYVGKVTSAALAVRDDEYDLQSKTCKPLFGCELVHYNGSGTVGGLTISARRKYNIWFIEPGFILERATWQVDMPDWTDGKEPRFHLYVNHKVRPMLFPTLAVGYKRDNITVKLSAIPTAALGDEWQALYRGVSLNLSVGYTFK